jgi:alpha-tubulin suppressor-like RCC1 family protein
MVNARVARTETISGKRRERIATDGGIDRVLIFDPRMRSLRGYAAKGGGQAALLVVLAAMAGPVLSAGGPAAQEPAGIALAWGSNDSGQLGDCGGAQSSVPARAALPAGADVTAVAAGYDDSLALTSDGRVFAWGNNYEEQLGDGSNANSYLPVLVDLPAGTRVTAIAAGYWHGLALTSGGRVLAWGDNGNGELGDGTTVNRSVPVPVRLPAGAQITAIAGGGNDSMALTSDGRVFAWGFGNVGQLGNGRTADSSVPVAVDLPAGTRVTAISAGNGFDLAVTSDGRVLAWGFGTFGTLGDGGSANSSVPVRVDVHANTRITAVAAGDLHSLAVTAGGRVLAWGDNLGGALGDGDAAGNSVPVPVPVDLPAATRVTAVAAGAAFSLAVTSGGRALAWGSDFYGQLGDGSTADRPVPVPVGLPAGTRVTAVSAGGTESLAVAVHQRWHPGARAPG